jgi:hypothetical protein
MAQQPIRQPSSIAVRSENHTKIMNTLCGQNEELVNVKAGGIHSYHWVLKCRGCWDFIVNANPTDSAVY